MSLQFQPHIPSIELDRLAEENSSG